MHHALLRGLDPRALCGSRAHGHRDDRDGRRRGSSPRRRRQSAIRSACRADYQANCAGVPPGGQASLACLQQNVAKRLAGLPAGGAAR